jgi:serine acetyltransferase
MSDPLEVTDVRVSRVTVNDDMVKLVAWHVADGEPVKRGALLYTVETSKATFDVEADVDGVLETLSPLGAEVEVGTTIARVWAHAPARPAARVTGDPMARTEVVAATNGQSADSRLVSRKAQSLLDQHGLSPFAIPGTGMIREEDVLAVVVKTSGTPAAAPREASELAAASAPSLASVSYRRRNAGEEAQDAAAARGRGVAWLAWNYLWRTWLLTNLTRWAPRGLLIPIHRLRGVKIGHDCFIDPSATLETAHAYNIVIGDDVRIAAGAVIMTHIKAPNYLRESGMMPAVLRPVVLEDHCFIGVNAVVMPGVRVGKAAVVASGAVVLSDVPDFTMVAGNPARMAKRLTPNG